MPKRQPTEFEGQTYASISEAVDANGGSRSLRRWLERGCRSWAEIEAFTSTARQRQAAAQGKACVWNGVPYESISEAARANGRHLGTMARWIARGWTKDSDIPAQYRRKSGRRRRS